MYLLQKQFAMSNCTGYFDFLNVAVPLCIVKSKVQQGLLLYLSNKRRIFKSLWNETLQTQMRYSPFRPTIEPLMATIECYGPNKTLINGHFSAQIKLTLYRCSIEQTNAKSQRNSCDIFWRNWLQETSDLNNYFLSSCTQVPESRFLVHLMKGLRIKRLKSYFLNRNNTSAKYFHSFFLTEN